MPRSIRVGLLNIMPDTEGYERLIRRALDDYSDAIELHPIRLLTHDYGDNARCQGFAETQARTPLDLLIITGAPVEHLDYEQVSYWPELKQVIHSAHAHIRATAGICFGALAVARHLGIGKRVIPGKAFGLYRLRLADSKGVYADEAGREIRMPFSTRALLDGADVQRAVEHGELRRVACGDDIDAVLESNDRRLLMIVGHPEYEADTLRREWLRDCAKGIAYTRDFSEEYFDVLPSNMPERADSVLSLWIASHIEAIREKSLASEVAA